MRVDRDIEATIQQKHFRYICSNKLITAELCIGTKIIGQSGWCEWMLRDSNGFRTPNWIQSIGDRRGVRKVCDLCCPVELFRMSNFHRWLIVLVCLDRACSLLLLVDLMASKDVSTSAEIAQPITVDENSLIRSEASCSMLADVLITMRSINPWTFSWKDWHANNACNKSLRQKSVIVRLVNSFVEYGIVDNWKFNKSVLNKRSHIKKTGSPSR